jgi:hypothetical protein
MDAGIRKGPKGGTPSGVITVGSLDQANNTSGFQPIPINMSRQIHSQLAEDFSNIGQIFDYQPLSGILPGGFAIGFFRIEIHARSPRLLPIAFRRRSIRQLDHAQSESQHAPHQDCGAGCTEQDDMGFQAQQDADQRHGAGGAHTRYGSNGTEPTAT